MTTYTVGMDRRDTNPVLDCAGELVEGSPFQGDGPKYLLAVGYADEMVMPKPLLIELMDWTKDGMVRVTVWVGDRMVAMTFTSDTYITITD